MTVRTPTWRRVVAASTIALAAATLVATCGRAQLPPRLAGLARTSAARGEAAARNLAAMHGRRVTPRDSAFAEYGGGRLRLWLSVYPSASEAAKAQDAMLAGIATGRTPFSPAGQRREWGSRWFTFGPGGHNLFWTSGTVVYWLQGEPGLLAQAIEELPAPPSGSWT